MGKLIQRSMLILPVHVKRFVEKAYLRGADAILLDLEDAVPAGEKEMARKMVEESIGLAGRGGADVLVRINNEPALWKDDLDSAVHPGLHGIFVPKAESGEDVAKVEAELADLESQRGLDPGGVKLAIHIESPMGLLQIREIVDAGSRIESVSLGVDDYCLELGVEPSENAEELFLAFSMMVTVAKGVGISPIGVLGTVANYQDLDGFRRAAQRARQMGADGAYCVHPGQVAVLNEVFSPTPQSVEHSRRVREAFEAGLKEGRAAVSLDGKMVDTPIYKRAMTILERAQAIAEREQRKTEALDKITHGP